MLSSIYAINMAQKSRKSILRIKLVSCLGKVLIRSCALSPPKTCLVASSQKKGVYATGDMNLGHILRANH